MASDLPDFTSAVSGVTLSPVTSAHVINNAGSTFDVSAYQAVIVVISQSLNPAPLTVIYDFETAGGFIIDVGQLSSDPIQSVASFSLPVAGQILRLQANVASGQITATVYGVNTQMQKRMLLDWNPARLLAATVPNGTASGTGTQLFDLVNTFALSDVTCYNGPVSLTWIVGNMSGATRWDLQVGICNETGVITLMRIDSVTAAGTYQFTSGHPFQFTGWYVTNTGALTSASSHNVNILPSSAP